MREKESWRSFLALIKKAGDEDLLSDFFKLYLTEQEVEMLCLRYELISKLLVGEDSQREISKKLGISISKVTRGSNELKRVSPRLKEFITKEQKGSPHHEKKQSEG